MKFIEWMEKHQRLVVAGARVERENGEAGPFCNAYDAMEIAWDAACEAQMAADAHLMAAAPDLVAVLDEINMMACYASEEDIDSREAMLLKIGEAARAAIAKATPERRTD